MLTGLSAGLCWALETVILALALSLLPAFSSPEALFLLPLVSTFMHDAFSAIFMFIINLIKGNFKNFSGIIRHKNFKWLVLASIIGGPIGMTGYVLAVNFMGSSVGAVASAIYPAIGTLLAFFFLKEKVNIYRWIFLILTLLGVFGLSFSPDLNVKNYFLGLLGAFMCAFGWGIEAVILAKCFKETNAKNEQILFLRQTSSALTYGLIIIPIIGGYDFTFSLIKSENLTFFIYLFTAAVFASVSYLFYYKAISKLGASKAMALNITYTAWAVLFTVILTKDLSILNPLSIICSLVVVVCGILSATDFKALSKK